ncbi:MAG: dephospho-CoA kinase [Pelosinus sp.]|nr:dephospho-CoA kinase [Pelosinus sp.]
MYIIGLTGGIASGKSTVSRMLTELGAYIVDADKIAHDAILPGKPAFEAITQRLGRDILSGGKINREKLGQLVFDSVDLRAWLEEITHPYIRREAQRQLAEAKEQEYDVAVLDVPLLFEVKWETMADEVWVVYVLPEVQLDRLMARSHLSKKEALARIQAQRKLADKAKLAQVVIDNNRDTETTAAQVLQAWCRIRQQTKN